MISANARREPKQNVLVLRRRWICRVLSVPPKRGKEEVVPAVRVDPPWMPELSRLPLVFIKLAHISPYFWFSALAKSFRRKTTKHRRKAERRNRILNPLQFAPWSPWFIFFILLFIFF